MPVQVYMRLRVRDLAGNESVAVTADPQLVDLSEPEGKLLNVSVSPRVLDRDTKSNLEQTEVDETRPSRTLRMPDAPELV